MKDDGAAVGKGHVYRRCPSLGMLIGFWAFRGLECIGLRVLGLGPRFRLQRLELPLVASAELNLFIRLHTSEDAS